MTTIYLIRHGEAEGNLYRRMHGCFDSDLTDLGRQQAAALGKRFASAEVDAVYSSPLRRAMQTAAPICLQKRLPLHTDSRLREINVGRWEGIPFGNAAIQDPAEYDIFVHHPEQYRMEGADTIVGLAARGFEALSEIARKHDGQHVAVCAHSYLINAVMCRLFYGFEHFRDNGVSYNTAVTCLQWDRDRVSVLYANDYTHITQAGLQRSRWSPDPENPAKKADLNILPFGSNIDLYIRYRGDAWDYVYGSRKDFNGPGFWLDAQRTIGTDPNAMVLGRLGGTPVGMLQLSPDRDARKHVGYIPFIYMRPEFRHKGLGIQLIGHAVQFYRDLGRRHLQLSVSPSNVHAIEFYHKFGFTEAGKTPGRYGKLILMDKDLTMSPMPKGLRILPMD